MLWTRIIGVTLGVLVVSFRTAESFSVSAPHHHTTTRHERGVVCPSALCRGSSCWRGESIITATTLFVAKPKASYVPEVAKRLDEAEKGAGVEGAEFFGGNKKKENLFDAEAEKNAGVMMSKDGVSTYLKFEDVNAFPDPTAKAVALSLQQRLNDCLYLEERITSEVEYSYSPTMRWETPFQKRKGNQTPLDELRKAIDFYNRVDVAITSGKLLPDGQVELRWEISVAWPIFWEPRILITGTSKLTLNDDEDKQIVQQVDTLDQDLLNCIQGQIIPRFFDLYHLLMSPSAELSPKVKQGGASFFAPYSLYKLPPRLMYRPSLINAGDRDDGMAESLPNHGFSCVIRTVGQMRQRYVTCSPMEVELQPDANLPGKNRITWALPMSVEVQTNEQQPLPGYDEETNEEWFPTSRYEFMPERLVATISYGGMAQDEEIADLRKKLYEAVIKDGFKPKLDETSGGRPKFFFWEQRMKMCYVSEGGLGMAIHHWRPNFVKTNAVGIELEKE